MLRKKQGGNLQGVGVSVVTKAATIYLMTCLAFRSFSVLIWRRSFPGSYDKFRKTCGELPAKQYPGEQTPCFLFCTSWHALQPTKSTRLPCLIVRMTDRSLSPELLKSSSPELIITSPEVPGPELFRKDTTGPAFFYLPQSSWISLSNTAPPLLTTLLTTER
jgi:hypothetical protein